jgi:hypothetical protein
LPKSWNRRVAKATESNHAQRLRDCCNGRGGRYRNCIFCDRFGSKPNRNNEPIRAIYARGKYRRSQREAGQSDEVAIDARAVSECSDTTERMQC